MYAMLLTLGPDRQTRSFTCECCSAPIERSWCLVHADGTPHALYYANCYHHTDRDHDAWIDVIFGTWGQGVEAMSGHVSFGCRVGPVVGQTTPAATLVDAGTIYPDGPLFGQKLDREAGLRHPRLAEFWSVVDFVLEADPLVRGHLYEH
ncbi:hypothetical protein C0036_08910 [Streptomyces sp. DJ]|nr:hypothetical protein C0036_08910 [Streptomyces sp. DJ]